MTRARRFRPGLPTLVVYSLALALAGSVGCSSEDFSPTGSDLPSDVSQDSLLVPLYILGTIDEARFDMPRLDPPQGQPIPLREFLYFGTLAATDWKATPFVRYDFSGADPELIDSLRAHPELIKNIQMSFREEKEVGQRGSAFQFQLYALNTDLEDYMAEGPASLYLGQDMGQHTADRGQTFTTDLLEGQTPAEALAIKNLFLDWWAAGTHPGIAMVDLAADSSLAGLASRDFNEARHEYLLAAQNEGSGVPFIIPRITLEYDDPNVEEPFLTVESESDLTVFDRSVTHTSLALGGHLIARTWLDFDLSVLPLAATINSADLVLNFDRSQLAVTGFPGTEIPYPEGTKDPNLIARADKDRTFEESTLAPIVITALVYESTRAQAEALTTSPLTQLLDALRNFRPDVISTGTLDGDDELRVNITDFVQRVANGVFPGTPPGLLLDVTQQELQFFEAAFFDSSAPDSLKPRLEIRYSPPADYVP